MFRAKRVSRLPRITTQNNSRISPIFRRIEKRLNSEACRLVLGRPSLLARYAAYGASALRGLYGDAENRFQALGDNPSRIREVDLVVEALLA